MSEKVTTNVVSSAAIRLKVAGFIMHDREVRGFRPEFRVQM